jgi:hypothetical protein
MPMGSPRGNCVAEAAHRLASLTRHPIPPFAAPEVLQILEKVTRAR